MSPSFISAILLSAAIMNVEADSLPYLAPPSPWWPSYSYAFRKGDSILREKGEKLLLNNAEPRPYGIKAVIVLVTANYGRVCDALRGLMAERWGILDEQEAHIRPAKMESSMAGLLYKNHNWPILGNGLSYLQINAPLKTARECELTSRLYNLIDSINGSSQAVIRISDGSLLSGQEFTILQVSRIDHSREWARSGELHGIIPLPYKEDRWNVGIVTSTEIALIEDLKKQIPGVEIRYFLTERHKGEGIREKMQEAVEQLKKQ